MKCYLCENDLPNGSGWATLEKSGKYACGKINCRSFGISTRSKDFQILVMRKPKDLVDSRWRARVKKGVQTKKEAGFFDDKSNNPYSSEFWKKQGLSDEDALQKLSSKNKKSAATKKEAGFFDDKSNNPYSSEFWKKQGLSDEDALARIKSKNHNCREYWITRGYCSDDALVLARNSAKTNSLPEHIKRYGEELGHKKHNILRQKMRQSWTYASANGKNFASSKSADKFFLILYRKIRRLGYNRNDMICNLNRGELFVHANSNMWFYDFCIKPLKVIIEFNGEHVHPNKSMSHDEWANWRHAFSKKTADEVIELTNRKITAANELGYKILEVWSKDPNKVETAMQFIKEAHNEYHGN